MKNLSSLSYTCAATFSWHTVYNARYHGYIFSSLSSNLGPKTTYTDLGVS